MTSTLTLTGTGFDNTTSAELVGTGGKVYTATSVAFDTPTQLTATFNLTGVPQGTYGVEVTKTGGISSTLPGAFTVTAAGMADLVTHLILPKQMGRHVSSTIYVEYANDGNVAMPAPLLVLEAPPR